LGEFLGTFAKHLCVGLAGLFLTGATIPVFAFEIDGSVDFTRPIQLETQQKLHALGFDTGTPDGDFGPRSQRAFTAFWNKYVGMGEPVLSSSALALLEETHKSQTTEPWATAPADAGFFGRPRDIFTWDARKAVASCADGDCRVQNIILGVGDLTNDGRDEIVVGTYMMDGNWDDTGEPGPILILSPDERGNLHELPIATDAENGVRRQHPRDTAIADFNGDGVNDLFIMAHGHDHAPYPGEQNVLLLSTPEGLVDVSDSHIPQRDDFTHGGGAGDLDGDGDIDIVVITNYGAGKFEPYVLWNGGDGMFEPAGLDTILDRDLATFMGGRQEHRSKYTTAHIADVDQDGYPDLVLLGSGDDADRASQYPGMRYTRIAFGDGSGKWTAANTVELPADRWGAETFATSVQVVDLDGDGANDLVLTLGYNDASRPAGASWRGNYIQIFKGQGRHFTDITAAAFSPQGYDDSAVIFATRSFVADINQDGQFDIVNQSQNPWRLDDDIRPLIAVAIGQPDGRMTWADPKQWEPETYTGRDPVLADIDGDGDLDLVAFRLNSVMAGDDLAVYGLKMTAYANTTVKAP
jgi:hypothetical protein